MSIKVTADDVSAEAWDEFVRRQPQWTAFHLSGWNRVFAEQLGLKTTNYVARTDDGALRGLLAMVRVKSPVFGHFVVSAPFVNHGGPLGDGEAVKALAAAAVRDAIESGADLLELRSRAPLPLELPVSHRKVAVLLSLPGSPDALFKTFPPKLRSQVRKPQKEGVTVRFGRDRLDDFYHVFTRHMRDLGTPVHSLSFFAALADHFREDVWIGVAYAGAHPIACGMGFRWGAEFEMTWASALREYSRMAPNMLLYWEFMRYAIAHGCHTFNFGRSTPGASTHKFKMQWGGSDEVLHWYQYTRSKRTSTPSPDGGMLSLAPRIWRKLPLAVTTTIGPHLVRHIP